MVESYIEVYRAHCPQSVFMERLTTSLWLAMHDSLFLALSRLTIQDDMSVEEFSRTAEL
jgi:hypothetical protein